MKCVKLKGAKNLEIATIKKHIGLIKNKKQLKKINNLRRFCGLENIETI